MKANHRRAVWQSRVPVVDATLCECILRVTSRDPRSWGYLLAKVREARRWSLATQATALGIPESSLVFLSVCRLPRADRGEDDLVLVADRMGVPAAALRFVLDLATDSSAAGNTNKVTGGAA
jgi:hypothetical protein